MEDKEKVILFAGGSFNPPTIMHRRMLFLARYALMQHGYEVVGAIISPVSNSYNKPGLVDVDHRLKMLHMTFPEDWICVSDWEGKHKEWLRTIVVLNHHQEKNPSQKLMVVCGTDYMFSFADEIVWSRPDVKEIVKNYGIVGILRSEDSMNDCEKFIENQNALRPHKDNIVLIDERFCRQLSATQIRKGIKDGYPITGVVHPDVEKYILDNKLYTQ